jgi:16S rRNA (adenine1518-N6/adenine1519-N6)-dimethyltransferase
MKKVPEPPRGSSALPPPSKRFGQHFLTDKRIIDRIVSAVHPRPGETVIEIGPGRGALTAKLLDVPVSVVAVELDRKLIPLLEQQFGENHLFKLVAKDALQTDFCTEILPATTARVAANLPYNISTAILQRLIEQRSCLSEMVLMLQREVVERITAQAGSSDRGYLSVLMEAYTDTEKLFDVSPRSFRPPPKVMSSVIRVTFRKPLSLSEQQESLLWDVVSVGFAQRRKTILNNLRAAPAKLSGRIKENGGASIVLCRAEVDLQRRAETLKLEEWVRIAEVLA